MIKTWTVVIDHLKLCYYWHFKHFCSWPALAPIASDIRKYIPMKFKLRKKLKKTYICPPPPQKKISKKLHVYDCWSGIVVSMQQMHVWLCVHGMFLITHLIIPCLICLFYTLCSLTLPDYWKKYISVWYVVCSSIEQNKSMFGMWSVDLLNSSDTSVFGMYVYMWYVAELLNRTPEPRSFTLRKHLQIQKNKK